MSFSVFFNYDGNCREAMAFYAKAFASEVEQVMTYDQMPADPNYPLAEADKQRIAYAQVPIEGCNLMFCDMPSGTPLAAGNHISPTVGLTDKHELRRLFDALAEGGQVDMPLDKVFWSELYGMVTDRYGITWQIMINDEQNLD